MRKLLLLSFLIGMVGVTFAQVSQLKPKKWYSEFHLPYQSAIDDMGPVYTSSSNQYVRNTLDEDIVVGETWYDLQSNSSVPQHIWRFEDGTIATVWTRGMEPEAYPGRGTGYNYHDGTSWGDFPTERIEPQRTGWPTIQPYGPNGEIIVSHTGGNEGLIFSYRPNKGEGDWIYFFLAGPEDQPDLLWPRMITTGENNDVIHVIATVGNGVEYQGQVNALVYSRSSDGGETWNPQNIILEGIGSDFSFGWGGDDYAWATPNANTIAFVVGSVRDGVIMKSTDDGDTWQRVTFYESPDPFFDGNTIIDRFGALDGCHAAVIDDNGIVHVASGRMCYRDESVEDGFVYFPFTDGLIYWNETMDPLDSTIVTNEIIAEDWEQHPLFASGNLAAWVQPGDSPDDTLRGPGETSYQSSLTSFPALVLHKDVNGNDILQMFYSSHAVKYVEPNTNRTYRHIYGRFTELDGKWSEFTDYMDDIFHLFSEGAYPSVAPIFDNSIGQYDVVYQSDALPGNHFQPDPVAHEAVLNNIVYLPIIPLTVDVDEIAAVQFDVSQNQPNPASFNTTVQVAVDEAATIELSVSNLLGQVVHRDLIESNRAGIFSFNMNVSEWESGIYLYTVKVGNTATTQKMMVQ